MNEVKVNLVDGEGEIIINGEKVDWANEIKIIAKANRKLIEIELKVYASKIELNSNNSRMNIIKEVHVDLKE